MMEERGVTDAPKGLVESAAASGNLALVRYIVTKLSIDLSSSEEGFAVCGASSQLGKWVCVAGIRWVFIGD